MKGEIEYIEKFQIQDAWLWVRWSKKHLEKCKDKNCPFCENFKLFMKVRGKIRGEDE